MKRYSTFPKLQDCKLTIRKFNILSRTVKDLVVFYGISTLVGYLMLNPVYTYILNVYDLVWFCFMEYQPLWVI